MAKHAEDIKVDKKDQLEKIEGVCLPDELIRAVFDLKGMGTGFLGITDKRIIFYDKAFLKKKKALVSIPHSHIAAVASEDRKGLIIRGGFLITDTLTISPSVSIGYGWHYFNHSLVFAVGPYVEYQHSFWRDKQTGDIESWGLNAYGFTGTLAYIF